MSARCRFPPDDYPLSDELCAFMDAHPEFLAALKLANPRFRFLPQVIVSHLPPGSPRASDEILGLWYLDTQLLPAGRGPLFKQDFIVNLDGRNVTFVAYTAAAHARGLTVRPIHEFFERYGDGQRYYHRTGDKPWQHHYADVENLPTPELRTLARAALARYPSPTSSTPAAGARPPLGGDPVP